MTNGIADVEKTKKGATGPRVCPRCAFDNRPDAVYCGNCGAHLIGRPCPACQALNPDDLLYCDNCGTWLDKPAQRRTFTITYPAKFPRLPILFAVPALIVFMCALGIINQAASLIWPSHNPAGIPLAVTGIFLLMVSLIQMVLCALIAHADHSR